MPRFGVLRRHEARRFDVALYGLWYGRNYGSQLTYFALRAVLQSLGHSVIMIDNPLEPGAIDDASRVRSHPYRFARRNGYAIAPRLPLERMNELNPATDTFLVGSDQLWNYDLSRAYGDSYYLAFTDDAKRRIAYGTSFGAPAFNGPIDYRGKVRDELARFATLMVRDPESQAICHQEFDLPAQQVTDPVFLCEKAQFDSLAERPAEVPGEFLFAYVLDPTPAHGQQIKRLAEDNGLAVVVVLDELDSKTANNRKKLGLDNNPQVTIVDHATVGELLWCFDHAKFVVTDSFHGCCFSIVYQRDFWALKHPWRAPFRFQQVLGPLGLSGRLLAGPANLDGKGLDAIDYAPVMAELKAHGAESIARLKESLEGPFAAPLPEPDVPYSADRLSIVPVAAQQLAKQHPAKSGWRRAKGVRTPYVPATLAMNPLCSGCLACVDACPFDALQAATDKYGLLRPQLIPGKCTDCGLCVRMCPAIVAPEKPTAQPQACYSFQTDDEALLMASASGGVFGLLARRTIADGGAVVGAAWGDGLTVGQVVVTDLDDLPQLHKSKYCESNTAGVYREVRRRLKDGQQVLFSGLPCQVAGLRGFLKGASDNLLAVDLLCGNAPGQAMLRGYVRETWTKGVAAIEFRHKEADSHDPYLSLVTLADGTQVLRPRKGDAFQTAFHAHNMCPLHCENCQYQALPRYGDITIGDFWGLQQHDRSVNMQPGMSVILVNNSHGAQYLAQSLGAQADHLVERPLEWLGGNGFTQGDAHGWAPPERDAFFAKWAATRSFTQSVAETAGAAAEQAIRKA